MSDIIRETEIEIELNNEMKLYSDTIMKLDKGQKTDTSSHTILNADYTDGSIIRYLGKQKADLILTSPPYNAGMDYGKCYDDNKLIEEYCEFLDNYMDISDKILNPNGGRFIVNVRDVKIGKGSRLPILTPFYDNLCLIKAYNYRGVHIWYKGREENSTAWGSWKRPENPSVIDLFEYVYVFQKGEMNQKNRPYEISKEEFVEYDFGIWKIRPVQKIYGGSKGEKVNIVNHPCPFPIELPQRCIKLYTYSDALVLDPFGGIGSTSLAAHNTGRNSISVEISEDYCNTAYNRLKSENVNVKLVKESEIPMIIPIDCVDHFATA